MLVTGASGQVGSALVHNAPPATELRALGRAQLNIGDAAAVKAAVADFQPQLIINAAAYTAVDKAESEPDLAAAINAQGPRYLAEAAAALPDCRLLHISTDYVFNGRAAQPYQPSDATDPLSVYGHTKLDGEHAVLGVLAERAVVLRTAWVYAAVRVVGDQKGTPTAAASIARALWRIAELPAVHGVLHWTDGGVASWYEFACAIAEDARTAGLLSQAVTVTPITTADYPTAAHRPANSALDCRASTASLGISPEHWRTNLRSTLAEISHT